MSDETKGSARRPGRAGRAALRAVRADKPQPDETERAGPALRPVAPGPSGEAAPKRERSPDPGAAGPDANPAAEAVTEDQPGKEQPGKKGRRKKKASLPEVVEVAPMARPAQMRQRHWGLMASFLVLVLAPLAVTAWYLWGVAVDQYGSTVGFTVRREEANSASQILGGLAQFTGSTDTADSDILYEFIQSPALVERVRDDLPLVESYSAPHEQDPIFALSPDATLEDLARYWERIVRVSYDQASGLIELRVLAFDPEIAQKVAQAVLAESQALINSLNAKARADTIAFAQSDLEEAIERLKTTREALTAFRVSTQIVDPETDIQGRMGVINNLQQSLAEALVEYDLLLGSTSESDTRVRQAQQRIDVIRDRIAQERETFASSDASIVGEDYPSLIAEYEGLMVDREFAEESYRASLAALDAARANAVRQSRYLAAYIEPTYPHAAEYPQRWSLFGLAALFLFLAWGILALVYYSIRDSR